jgi:hypothetical protein
MITPRPTPDLSAAHIERMRRAWVEWKARWEAKLDKVYLVNGRDDRGRNPDAAYITDEARIDWKTAEAISGIRVDRRLAYFLREGKVLTWWLALCDKWSGTPLIEYDEFINGFPDTTINQRTPSPAFVLIDPETGEKIEIGSRRHTIRRADHDYFGNRSSAYIIGFDPPSVERAQGCVRYVIPSDDREATASPSFFEAIIVEDDPAKIRQARREFTEAREWQALWNIIGDVFDGAAP